MEGYNEAADKSNIEREAKEKESFYVNVSNKGSKRVSPSLEEWVLDSALCENIINNIITTYKLAYSILTISSHTLITRKIIYCHISLPDGIARGKSSCVRVKAGSKSHVSRRALILSLLHKGRRNDTLILSGASIESIFFRENVCSL